MGEMVTDTPDSYNALRDDIRRLSDKVDGQHNVFVTRQEYVTNNATLAALISTVASQVTQLAATVDRNREAVEKNTSEGGKWLLDQFDKLEERIAKRLDAHITNHSQSNQWVIGLLYGTGSAIVAGLAIAIVQHFIH